MPSTKIINILKDDSFEEIFDIFSNASAKEVIFVLPKKSKVLQKENEFIALSKESLSQEKSISLLCSNPSVNQLAKKYNFEILLEDKGDQAGFINTVNQFEENEKPSIEPRREEKLEDLPPWGNIPLPGLPIEDLNQKQKTEANPILKPKITKREPELPPKISDYQLVQAVKIKKIEDIIQPNNENSINIKINPKKEKPAKIDIHKSYLAEDNKRTLDEIDSVWKEESSNNQASSNIWSDWNLSLKDRSLSPKHKKFKLKLRFPVIKPRMFGSKIIASLVLVIVFALATVFYVSGGNAKVFITPHKQVVDFKIKISASNKYASIDFSSNKIPGQLFTVEKELSQNFNATGEKDAIQKARGRITVYNKLSFAQPLVATTRFESESKLIFRTLTSIIVPPAKIKNDKTVPGAVEVEVIADKPGPDYNISTGKFVIVAFRENGDTQRYNGLYATLSGSMRGGINGKATVVLESDYSLAKETITQKLSQDLEEAIKIQTNQFKIIYTTGVIAKNPVSTAKPEDAVTNFSMAIAASIKTIGFKESDLYEILNNYVHKTGNFIIVPEKIEVKFQNIKFDQTNNVLDFDVLVKGNVYTKINETMILNDLTGKKNNEIRDYLQNNSDIESARVVLSPFWIRKFPKDKEKITYQLVY